MFLVWWIYKQHDWSTDWIKHGVLLSYDMSGLEAHTAHPLAARVFSKIRNWVSVQMSERLQIGQMSESWGIEGKSATVIESWHFFLQYVEKHFQVKEIQCT